MLVDAMLFTGSGSEKGSCFVRRLLLLALFFTVDRALSQPPLKSIPSQPAFSVQTQQDGLSIKREAVALRPFSVVGSRGAILGQQDGTCELWLFPWKVLSNLRISARMDNYPVPIDVNQHAAQIEVRPDSTVITYSHANFTIRQILVALKTGPDDAGAMIFYQIEAVRPMTLTFSFSPVMQRMWPAPSDDHPSPEWVPTSDSGGFYILHLNFPDHTAAIAMPAAEPDILEPYQERAESYPLQFVLRFDPVRDSQKLFPLLVTLGNTKAESSREALSQKLLALDQSAQSVFDSNRNYYRDLLRSSMSIDTPDQNLNEAFSWAVASMDQLRVQTTPDRSEEALTAGFFGSGDTVRPGFGWFFGRDALWSIYAVDSYGGFDTTRKEIEFLLRRQSPEGKIIHEWSQTANLVDWKSLPYEYAAADATALLPMAVNDYLRISGDKEFVAAHWENLERAWRFESTHDLDGDGIYSNSQGTAWVESWQPETPQQEIYLAALDEQASLAFASLANATGHTDEAVAAQKRAARIRQKIESQYYMPAQDFYSFSWNGSAGTDNTPTIFPAVAWWDGDYSLDRGNKMFSRWASAEFSTDWGTRSASDRSANYDPISYHQGSVWPLFTGWVAVAEYRTGHTLAGYAHLMQNADLTWAQDLGNVTELLSGRFYQPLGRSTAHQLWSSAMVISPVVRGLFGLEWDVPQNSLTVTPHLPADWQDATIHSVPFGDAHLDLRFTRSSNELAVEVLNAPPGISLASRAAGAHADRTTLHVPLPDVEFSLPDQEPRFGDTTHALKVLEQQREAHHSRLVLAGIGGSTYTLRLRENAANLKVSAEGAILGDLKNGLRTVTVVFPPATGYENKAVDFSW
jgi:glycogen debranching enzyme